MIYYTVYKITNIINGKFYIGKHKTRNLGDGYFGSGVILKKAIQKYGRKNFMKEILYVFDNELEMNLKEQELVQINEQTYNVNIGGYGGFDYINNTGINRGANNVMHRCPDIKKKINERARITRASNPEFYNKIARQNLSISHQRAVGRIRPKHAEHMRTKAKEIWAHHREQIIDGMSGTYVLTGPDGAPYNTNRLGEFCRQNFLPFESIWKSSKDGGRTLSKGKAKGWSCMKISAH